MKKILYFIGKFLKKIGLLKILNFSYHIKINGKKLRIPIIYQLGLDNFYNHEPWLDDLLKKILKNKQGAFIDVGVNIGQTLLKIKSIDANIEYFGFEPNPICCFYTNKLIKANNFQNCKIIPIGLSNKPALLKLFMNTDTDDAASLIEGFRGESSYTSKQCVPVFEGEYLLDTLGVNSISIIKIDVEGAELEVIQGLKNSITKHQPYILCEILPVYSSDFRKKRKNNLEKFLRKKGYRIYRILHNGQIIPLKKIENRSDTSLCEYLFVPKNGKWKK